MLFRRFAHRVRLLRRHTLRAVQLCFVGISGWIFRLTSTTLLYGARERGNPFFYRTSFITRVRNWMGACAPGTSSCDTTRVWISHDDHPSETSNGHSYRPVRGQQTDQVVGRMCVTGMGAWRPGLPVTHHIRLNTGFTTPRHIVLFFDCFYCLTSLYPPTRPARVYPPPYDGRPHRFARGVYALSHLLLHQYPSGIATVHAWRRSRRTVARNILNNTSC